MQQTMKRAFLLSLEGFCPTNRGKVRKRHKREPKRHKRVLFCAFCGLHLCLLWFVPLLLGKTPPQAQTAGAEVTFTATSSNVNDAGRGVRINVFRWSSDDDRNALVAAMNPPAQTGNADGAGERGRGAAGRGAGGRGRGRGDAPAGPPNPMAGLMAALARAPTIGYLW